MKFLRELAKKPWLTRGLAVGTDLGGVAHHRPSIAATGLWFYIGVATVMFSLIVAAYVLRLGNYGADPASVAAATSSRPWWTLAALCGIPPADDWQPMAEPALLWMNTGILIVSSIAWQMARSDVRHGRMDKLPFTLIAGGVLAFLFLAGQLMVWRQLVDGGQFAAASPAYAFFYLITAMHGLHLLGGLIFWGLTTTKVMQGAKAGDVKTDVNLCAIYWHYLLIIWIVMFVLLLIT